MAFVLSPRKPIVVIAGLDPAIHRYARRWMRGAKGGRSDAVFDGYARA
jgi:hypothetical protein